MSSNIPTRRVTRATRSVKENENANARPSRVSTRSKVLAAAGTATATTSKTTGGADTGAQHKRKREIAEGVTKGAENSKPPPKATVDKGKGKDTKVIPAGKVSKATTAITATRAPLRPVGTTRTTKSNTHVETKKNVRSEVDAMAIDLPSMDVVEVVVPAPARPSTSAAASKKATVKHAAPKHISQESFEEPVSKKRRTSSEAGDDAHLEPIEEEQGSPLVENVQLAVATVSNEDDVGWDDLDRDDDEDPLMVSEYAAEIYEYLRECEMTTMPNPNYVETQNEITWSTRGELIDWLIQLHSRFRLMPETLYLAINLVDRFLSYRYSSLAKLQLVGVTCMFISAKVEETLAPSVSNFIYAVESSYTEHHIIKAESYILKTINWNLSYPCPLNFLRRASKADDYNQMTRTLGKYFTEIGLLEWRLLSAPPSLLAAASLWLARMVFGFSEWTPNLRHFSMYPEDALIPTANIILNFVLKPIRYEQFYKKYAAKKYYKVSVHARHWATSLWEEGTHVDLKADLVQLKKIVDEQRSEQLAAEAEHAEEQEV
ncbi:hypothetical protein SCHPADRAFT_152778 [Schizopora paradoxa]|uniref:Uncharacterized protein n=1 Tax=Schizopora paradoxa TaxID=27342 RepID=A0A0H2RZX1_9AGAM|nr:hypothetical protein SCHPADRAFT_152778 [Schizopora paradoxa]